MSIKLNLKQSVFAGLLAGIAAAIINGALFFVFHAAGIIRDDIYPQPGQPMTIFPVAIASILPLLIGSVVFFFFEKLTANGFRNFAVITTILALLSLISPFTAIPGVTFGYAVVLCVMHLIAALALLYFIARAKQKFKIN